MALSVDPDSSLLAGSEPVFDIVCQPCSSDGKNVEAEAYCRDCCEHICGHCIKDHEKFSTMKHHQLVDKDTMLGTQDDLQVRDVCRERCPDHREEITKYFCPDHKALACSVCVTIKHKRCDYMDYIQDVAAGLEDRQDYKEFTTKLGSLKKKSKDTVTLGLEGKKRSSDCHAKAIQDLDAYRDELVNAVDKGIQDMKDQARQIIADDTNKIDKLTALGNQALTELQSLEIDFQNLLEKKHFCKMFVEMKRKEDTLKELQKNLDGMGDAKCAVSTFTFQPDEEVRTSVGSQDGLGKLVVTSAENETNNAIDTGPEDVQQMKASHVTDINVKTVDNKKTCYISGMAIISQDKIVIADRDNKTIKLIDTVMNTIISELKTVYSPFDVTVCNDTVAATMPGVGEIVFMKYDGGLVHERTITVDENVCMGIDWYDDKLYVVFDDEKKLEVMTTTGVVLRKFTTNDKGEQLFDKPKYVMVNATNKLIYVSDFNKDQVIMLDMDGKQRGVYEDDELNGPKQLAVDRTGMAFLCYYCDDTIHLLSPNGEEGRILLTRQDGLSLPDSVCYCEGTRRLFVGMKGDTVKVYQIS